MDPTCIPLPQIRVVGQVEELKDQLLVTVPLVVQFQHKKMLGNFLVGCNHKRTQVSSAFLWQFNHDLSHTDSVKLFINSIAIDALANESMPRQLADCKHPSSDFDLYEEALAVKCDGILGQDFLVDFPAKISVDFHRREVILEQSP